MKEDLPYPRKYRRRLPVILSVEEVAQVIDCARNLFHRALLMTAYTCGLRRSEVCRLKVSDIDSQRMMIRITQGKGGVDRDVPMSPVLLETLREHWRWMRPQTYLFPGTEKGWRVDRPVTAKAIWEAAAYAAKKGRHHQTCFAAHFEAQLGHPSVRSRNGSQDLAGSAGPR